MSMAHPGAPGRTSAGDAPAVGVVEVGLACCALEAAAAGCPRLATIPEPGEAPPKAAVPLESSAPPDAEVPLESGAAAQAGARGASGARGTTGAHGGSDAGRGVLVIAGTVTNAMAAAVKARYDALGQPRVVAFGACATSGGPYWDSYAVTPGIDRVLPVDLVVPGCPPRPEALHAALAGLEDRAGGTAAEP